MQLLLTKFHMYLENIILQVTNTNTWNNSPKDAFWRWFVQRRKGDAHHTNSKWAKPHGTVTHDQPKACHAKVVVKGWPLLRGGRSPLDAALPLWRWRLHAAMLWWCSPKFCAKHRQKHRLHSCISRGVPPSLNTHYTWASPHTPHSLVVVALLFSRFRARQSYLGELGSLEEETFGYE